MNIENNISSAFASGSLGLQRASSQIDQAASDIVSSTLADQSGELKAGVNITDSLIELNVADINAQASARVLSVANDTIGTLLDTFA